MQLFETPAPVDSGRSPFFPAASSSLRLDDLRRGCNPSAVIPILLPQLVPVLNIQALQAENFLAGVNLPILNGGRLACKLRSRAGISGVSGGRNTWHARSHALTFFAQRT